ncbi:alpha-amylase family protein [Pollutimonas thiosulfatoxidans]|uniref:Uncharacterized protein n=1 Tax=Pollutimonas thiosulfatoxidans TaxID=2028345 RepID=A0A410GEF4_9BURK|nr:hypothetical protein [Pollutimonas thiosulfatoxidans]QAA94645.1 hypothetical protein CKA81_12960 [Pollutimonas thiosulfatoxidans]
MKLETWVYPWDIASSGADAMLSEMRDLGLKGVRVASNYHPIGTLSPRSTSRRVLYTERGGVFFPARAERYGRIRPQCWPEKEVLNVWPQVAERVARYGMSMSAWTIGMFQPWVTHQLPETARVTPCGDAIPSMTCPANPDVRTFFTSMCADLAEQYPIEGIHLEGISFHHYNYGWVRPRILIDVAPWTNFLMSLCFCPSCCARASEKGADVEALRARILHELDKCFEAPGDTDQAAPLSQRYSEWLQTDEDFAMFISLREDAVVQLIREIADAVHRVRPQCRIGVWSPIEVDGSAGVKLDRVMDVIGSVLVWEPSKRFDEARQIRTATQASGHDVHLTHFQACGWPHGADSPELRHELETAYSLPVDSVAFYNYGLVRAGQMRRMIEIAQSLDTA